MPTVNLDRGVVESLLGKKLGEEELRDRISYLGTDLDDVTKEEIIVEVFPNRPDMLSEHGFARALSSFIGGKTGLRRYDVNDSDYRVFVDDSVKEVRPFTVCAVVKGLSLNDSSIKEIIQLQEKLHLSFGRNRRKVAIGIYPLHMIRFPVRYTAMKPEEIRFIPLDGGREMSGGEILKNHPTGKEYSHLLGNFREYPVFIDSNREFLSMPPIINSEKTGRVDNSTREVFVECSGTDINALKKALSILVSVLADMRGEIYRVRVEYGKAYKGMVVESPEMNPGEMRLDIGYASKILGVTLDQEKVRALLERMGYGVKSSSDKTLDVLIPSYRADILHQADLVEDVAIAYGYENFKEEEIEISTTASLPEEYRFSEKVAEIMTGLGFQELNTSNLINGGAQSVKMGIKKINAVRLLNSINTDYDTLRQWMLPSIMEVLSRNTTAQYPQMLFEIGRVFTSEKASKGETGVREEEKLSAVVCSSNSDYTSVRRVADYIGSLLGADFEVRAASHPSFIEGRMAKIYLNKREVGFMGEIHPAVLEGFKLEMPTAALEINLTKLHEILCG